MGCLVFISLMLIERKTQVNAVTGLQPPEYGHQHPESGHQPPELEKLHPVTGLLPPVSHLPTNIGQLSPEAGQHPPVTGHQLDDCEIMSNESSLTISPIKMDFLPAEHPSQSSSLSTPFSQFPSPLKSFHNKVKATVSDGSDVIWSGIPVKDILDNIHLIDLKAKDQWPTILSFDKKTKQSIEVTVKMYGNEKSTLASLRRTFKKFNMRDQKPLIVPDLTSLWIQKIHLNTFSMFQQKTSAIFYSISPKIGFQLKIHCSMASSFLLENIKTIFFMYSIMWFFLYLFPPILYNV